VAQRTNVGMQFAVSLVALIVMTIAGAWLGRVLTTGEMGLVFWFVLGVLIVFVLVAYLAVYRPLMKLEQAEKELARVTAVDAVTGLWNREGIRDRMNREMERAVRTTQPISFAIVDVDSYRDIYDEFGAEAGDSVLRSVGTLLSESFRKYDSAGRLGTQQFLMILPETELDDAARVADRLRHRIDEGEFAFHGKGLNVTVSVGLTQADIETGESADDVIERARGALQQAREEGGNCVRAEAHLAAVEGTGESA
jgi:diguanylate cyclase (GGDEF)-like protein